MQHNVSFHSQATNQSGESSGYSRLYPNVDTQDQHAMPQKRVYHAEQALIERFKETLNTETLQATFTCGGSLPILLGPNRDEAGSLTPRTYERVQEQRALTKGVTLRWGMNGDGRVLTLPVTVKTELKELVNACKPATFGRGGEDIYDQSYRRAVAMSAEDFMTDFCPYEAGIIDIVTQLLLPSITGELEPAPPMSEVARKNDLTRAQEIEIHYCMIKFTRQNGDYIYSADIQQCLAGLQILPATTEEMLSIMGRLDMTGTGLTIKADFVQLAAQRIRAKNAARSETAEVGEEKPSSANERQRKMMSRGIRAELYKLNIYTGPSGMFKAHVDTPRSESQIGSLVVCLPANFEGGALAVRHHGQEIVHDWAQRASGSQNPAIKWAAFYSDCEHEVLEVTSGHRITLTYNLFLAPGTSLLAGQPTSLEPQCLPLAQSLRRMLASEEFLPKGGYIGIHLAHSYPHTHPKLHAFVPSMLKGVDMALYESIVALGYKAVLDQITGPNLPSAEVLQLLESKGRSSVRHESPIVSNLQEMTFGDEPDEDDENTDDQVDDICEFYSQYEPDSDESESADAGICNEKVVGLRRRYRARAKITWLNEVKNKELCRAYVAYGNEATGATKYSSAALLVRIPNWVERSSTAGSQADPVVVWD
ncbi:hypothetical protein LTR37_002259 [Vermiconidia calcicola]|uniref:Uncharacterized protein n=1 Tax=Vermiconidia calcicola TaxID=1690605 RepID=A0ACC3NTF5_9PEZI|nr:hypothetical protein LTR37_002259 [Vermiconidia calcicola]